MGLLTDLYEESKRKAIENTPALRGLNNQYGERGINYIEGTAGRAYDNNTGAANAALLNTASLNEMINSLKKSSGVIKDQQELYEIMPDEVLQRDTYVAPIHGRVDIPIGTTTSPEGLVDPNVYVDTGVQELKGGNVTVDDLQNDLSNSMTDNAQFGGYSADQVLSFIDAMKNKGDQQQGDQTDYASLYKQMIDQGAGYLEPYREAGGSALAQLMQKQNAGGFDPGSFNYGGQQPNQFNYSGQPVDRSIASYMQDDPSLAWQQEQLQRQIDRSGAQQGRWGGGATMRESMREQQGLLSQDYANRFNRAAMERGADVGAETDRYGRAINQYGLDTQREQQNYQRGLTGYGLNANRLSQDFGRLSGVAGMGQQAATATGGMYSGLGSQLLSQQHQNDMFEKQLAEQRRLAAAQEESNMWSGLLGLIGGGAGMYFGGPAGAAAGYQAGNTLGGMAN
jgi:hypothetical protein